jgi:hypothetical protein
MRTMVSKNGVMTVLGGKTRKPSARVSAGRGLFLAGGRYWIRTSDFFRVKEALSR